MGMYDSVRVVCPNCESSLEFQSKAGECRLKEYELDNVPPSIAGDLIGESVYCRCGALVTLRGCVTLFREVTKPRACS